MREIIRIEHVVEWVKDGKKHFRTHAVVDDGTEVVGYGKDYDLGDKVEVFLDPKYDVIKMQKRT